MGGWFSVFCFICVNLQTGVQGRIRICEGKNVDMVLDEEIRELTEKLQRLQKRSKVKDLGAKKNKNFDKQVCVLQSRLEKIGGSSDEIYLREFQEMENISLSIKRCSGIDDSIVASGKLNVSMTVTLVFLLISYAPVIQILVKLTLEELICV